LAKDKKNAKRPKEAKALKSNGEPGKAGSAAKPKRPKRAKVAAVAKVAKTKAVDLASNPVVAEIVAASLVAAAAAIKNPKKARAMAASVGDELEAAGKGAQAKGNAFWQLAMDIARRSIEALGADESSKKSGKKAKK
jgi:hypothetical protein